jgi:hypothetical protein
MQCRRPSSSLIKDRLEAETTPLLRRVSTFARLVVRTLDPVRGSSSACAPSLSSSSSTGNRSGRDLRRRSVTMGISSSCEHSDHTCFICMGTGSGLCIFLCECVRYSRRIGLGYAHVEFRLGVVDALPHRPFLARHRCLGICRDWEKYFLVVDWSREVRRCRCCTGC